MDKASLVLLATILLSGCVSQQTALQVQAKADFKTAIGQCDSRNFKTHLEKSECIDEALRKTEYIYVQNKDLVDELIAEREVLSGKIDRHELSQEEANLQLAQFRANLIEQENQRRQQQRANAIEALSLMHQINPPSQPVQTYQPPTYQSPPASPSSITKCTSTPLGTTVYTNCY